MYCEQCNSTGPFTMLGILGSLAHLRCQCCGWDNAVPASELVEDESE